MGLELEGVEGEGRLGEWSAGGLFRVWGGVGTGESGRGEHACGWNPPAPKRRACACARKAAGGHGPTGECAQAVREGIASDKGRE